VKAEKFPFCASKAALTALHEERLAAALAAARATVRASVMAEAAVAAAKAADAAKAEDALTKAESELAAAEAAEAAARAAEAVLASIGDPREPEEAPNNHQSEKRADFDRSLAMAAAN
jgi:hypothetical protein